MERQSTQSTIFKAAALTFLVIAALAISLLIGCAAPAGDSSAAGDQSSSSDTETSESATPTTTSDANRTLVAYFSATGTTERVAQMIADATGGELYRIEAAEPYTEEELSSDGYYGDNRPYNESNDTTARPALASAPVPDGVSYTRVYLGYPIWYGKAPAVISSFLDQNTFANATIYPFCTSGSSSITESQTVLEEFYPNLNWMPGERFSSSTTQSEVDAWLKTLA